MEKMVGQGKSSPRGAILNPSRSPQGPVMPSGKSTQATEEGFSSWAFHSPPGV